MGHEIESELLLDGGEDGAVIIGGEVGIEAEKREGEVVGGDEAGLVEEGAVDDEVRISARSDIERLVKRSGWKKQQRRKRTGSAGVLLELGSVFPDDEVVDQEFAGLAADLRWKRSASGAWSRGRTSDGVGTASPSTLASMSEVCVAKQDRSGAPSTWKS